MMRLMIITGKAAVSPDSGTCESIQFAGDERAIMEVGSRQFLRCKQIIARRSFPDTGIVDRMPRDRIPVRVESAARICMHRGSLLIEPRHDSNREGC